MEFAAKLTAFEGPMDLLMHLIEKNKVDIYDIPIASITDQYLEYVNSMDIQDADLMSEFLVMAATLLDIKAKMLLPKEVDEDGNEEDPRAELVQKLLEYKMYKYMSFELKDRAVTASKTMYREQNIPEEVSSYRPPINLDKFIGDVTILKLMAVFDDVMSRSKAKVNPVAVAFGNIQRDEVKIEDRIVFLKSEIRKKKNSSFRKLLGKNVGKSNIIATFLAVLELMKSGEIHAKQDENSDDIILEFNPECEKKEEVSENG